MVQRVTRLTPEQRARIPAHRDKWIACGLSTEPMSAADRREVDRAVRLMYRNAGFAEPRAVVFVASPFTLRVASGVGAAAIAAYRSGGRRVIRRSAEEEAGAVIEGKLRDIVDAAFAETVNKGVDSTIMHGVAQPAFMRLENTISITVEEALTEAMRSQPRGSVRDAIDAAIVSAAGGTVPSFTLGLLEEWSHFRFGGGLSCSWAAWRTFFTDVCGLELAPDVAATFAAVKTVHSRCGSLTLHRDFAMVSERPCILKRDAGGRLHSEDGPAIAWSDGWGVYFWHGLRIPPSHEWIIEDRARLTPEKIATERNAELRRIMLERFGFERYLAVCGARLIAEDELHGQPRRLFEVNVGYENMEVIEVTNGSVEPDGSRRTFHLGAARDPRAQAPARTPAEAIAHSYGIAPAHYREAVRT